MSNTPKIRFRGFIDTWEQRKYEEIGDCITGGGLSYESLKDDGKYKCVLYGDLYTFYDSIILNIPRRTDEKGNTIIKNDILFPQSTTVDAVSLISPACLNEDTAETSGVFVIRPHEFIDGNFIVYYTKGNNYQRNKLAKKAQGTTIVHLYYDSIKGEIIMIPSYKEQQAISKFFMCVDTLITLHQQKCDKLKELKKYMLQNMFPRKGDKVPKIRFRGFIEEWEQRKLGETVSLRGRIGFRGYTQADLVEAGSGAITFSPADIDDAGNVSLTENKYVSWAKYEESPEIKVRVGDILFTKTASIGKVGYVRELKEKATINPQFALLTPNGETDGYFTFLSVRTDEFMKKVRDITGGSSVPTMSQEKLKKLTIMVPSFSEQQSIGEFFDNLDNLITLHQQKCDRLKELKKYMLQNMFPRKGE